MEEDQI